MSSPRRLPEHELFDAACTGRLTDSTRAELQKVLRESPQSRRRYLDYTALHGDLFGAVRFARLHAFLTDEMNGLDEEAVAPAAEVVTVQEGSSPTAASTADVRRARAAVAAALATAAALALMLRPVADEPVALRSPAAPTAAAEEGAGSWRSLVARINRVEGVEWAVASQAFAEADLIAAGESVAIASGLVEVEFRQGAVVVLEGPAHLIANDANAASLIQGKLAAFAPPWATGFRVDTPGVDVVDHGTEFAVNVTGAGSDARVNVVVTEGEVEVLADQQDEGGRRLRAGEGVQSADGAVQDGDDAAARQLTEQLPDRTELKSGVVVADRWRDWTPGVDGEPNRVGAWRYFTNESAEFGNPASYEELVWDASADSYRPADRAESPWLRQYVRVHREGGHPGRGRAQTKNQIDRYSITAFIVPEDGVYRLEAGWLERLWAKRWDRDRVLDIAVHVNDGPILMQEFCNRDSFLAFRQSLGRLSAGDMVYVGVGPNGADFNDKFRWGYFVIRETEPSDEPSSPEGIELADAD